MSRFQVPQDNRRACLCRDGSYSTKCCNADDYFAQGIGSIHKGETDSSGTIIEIDTEETISSTSITPTSQGSSTVIETDTTQTYTSTSSDAQDQDTTPPVITIIGSSTINLTVGDSYTDAGATATDDIDGDLTSSITTSGTVDTSTASTYTITYSVSDSSGNSTSETRTIVVQAASGDTPGTVTNDTWHYMTSLNTRFPTDSFGVSLTYEGNTYLGFTYTLSDLTDPDGLNPQSAGSREMRIDTASIDVGTFIADDDGILLDSADNHTVYDSDTGYYRFPPFAAFSTPIYMKIVSNIISLVNNPFSSYPIYKLEQDGNYIKVTEKIES